MKRIKEMSSSEIFANLSEVQKDDIYRMVWLTHVCNDVISLLDEEYENVSEEEKTALVEEVANAYVYSGKYDCNLSYWSNLKNLIDSFR